MSFRKIAFEVHKILGLATGMIVFIVAITGCCWVFRDEFLSLTEEPITIELREGEILTASRVREIASGVFPGRTIHGALFGQADAPIEVIFYESDPEFYKSVLIHPYSGAVLKTEDHLTGFFAFVLKGHMRLWLPREIGEEVVGVSILIFLSMLVSGIIIWMPRKRKNLKQRLTFSWKGTTKWKRKNFDLHAVTGFYICALAFIIAFTGSVMSYQWLREAVHVAAGGKKSVEFQIPENVTPVHGTESDRAIDGLLPLLRRDSPDAVSFELHYPYSEAYSIYVETSYQDGIYYTNDYRFFDAQTLEEIESPSVYGTYRNTSFADKIIRMNYDIHVGAIGGLPGKIIAFLISLLVATLPITGVLMWYGRTFKKSAKKVQVPAQ